MSDNNKLNEVVSKVDTIINDLQIIKEGRVKNKVYNTKELCKHLGVGRSIIDRWRQNGDISYSKLGQTILFTQKDVDECLMKNKVKYVS